MTTGAVFIGDGNFTAETPPGDFEKDNLKRLLGTENIESDFKTAVFRFTDDTATQLGQPQAGPANERAQKLANEADERMLKRHRREPACASCGFDFERREARVLLRSVRRWQARSFLDAARPSEPHSGR